MGFDFVWSLGWRNSRLEPSARVKAMRSQTVSASKKKEEKKGCHRGVGKRKKGREDR